MSSYFYFPRGIKSQRKMAKKEETLAQPVLSAFLCTEGLPVWFLVRVHAWVAGSIPRWDMYGSQFIDVSFSLPLSKDVLGWVLTEWGRGGEKEKTVGLGSVVQRWPGTYNYPLLALHGLAPHTLEQWFLIWSADQKFMECFIRVYMSNEHLPPLLPT